MSKSLLVAFDFDHTIIEDNSDIVIRRLLNSDEKALAEIKGLYRSCGWTAYMQKIFELLRRNGVASGEIKSAIEKIPAVEGLLRLMEKLREKRCVEIIVISDANSLFIEHWLRRNALEDAVHTIFTNPAWIEEKTDLLKIEPYQYQDWCDLSEKNMCKGHILEEHKKNRFLDEGLRFERIAYVGDGKNDFCPVLRLSKDDFAFPRRNFPLSKILQDPNLSPDRTPAAEVIPWTTGDDIWREIAKRVHDFS